jgi:hypothetical protein
MVPSFPSVQFSIKRAYRYIFKEAKRARWTKARANRRHRHVLNCITRGFVRDPEAFEDESFEAPSLGGYDIA